MSSVSKKQKSNVYVIKKWLQRFCAVESVDRGRALKHFKHFTSEQRSAFCTMLLLTDNDVLRAAMLTRLSKEYCWEQICPET